MTLLEVLAALVILSTLMAGLLMAKGRAQRQMATAQRRLEAVAVAEELMEQWCGISMLPVESSGEVPGHPSLMWQWQVLDQSDDSPYPFAISQLQIIGMSDPQVLAQVQWFVPSEPSEDKQATTTRPSTGGKKR